MFRMKRKNIFLSLLVMVLFVISYFNYAINKYSLLETSSDFERYEENKLAEVTMDTLNEELLEEEMKDDAGSNVQVDEENQMEQNEQETEQSALDVNVVDSTQSVVGNVVTEASTNIESNITSNKNMKKSNYFIEARLNTSIERERMVSMLNEIIDNDNTDDENRKEANNAKMRLIDIMNKEKIVENLIKAKGFEDALVFITENSVNVIVETEKLTDSDVAKILDIVTRETKVPLLNVKILNKF
ncbi:MAG: SpoIIIAH-like family protein [Bacillota bacterium]